MFKYSFINSVNPQDSLDEILTKHNLNWDVVKKPLYRHTASGNEATPYFELRRSDNDKPVTSKAIGSNYTPLQNSEAIAWFENFVANGEMTMDSVGAIGGGRQVFFIAKLAGSIEPRSGDEISKYVMLLNPFDGLNSVRVGFIPFRLACWNALYSATRQGSLIRLRHHRLIKPNLEDVKDIIDTINAQFTATETQLAALDKVGINERDLRSYVRTVFSMEERLHKDETTPRLSTRSENILNAIIERSELRQQSKEVAEQLLEAQQNREGELLDSILTNMETRTVSGGSEGTYYDAYNAVTRYLSHDYGRTEESRVENLFVKQEIPARALKVATEMAGVQ